MSVEMMIVQDDNWPETHRDIPANLVANRVINIICVPACAYKVDCCLCLLDVHLITTVFQMMSL